jgi:hypothetical protein
VSPLGKDSRLPVGVNRSRDAGQRIRRQGQGEKKPERTHQGDSFISQLERDTRRGATQLATIIPQESASAIPPLSGGCIFRKSVQPIEGIVPAIRHAVEYDSRSSGWLARIGLC